MTTERYAVRVAKEYFHFCTAHFLIFPDGSREPLHGHNYRVSVRVTGGLGAGGLVIDFLQLKPIVKELCDAIDHRVLLPADSEYLAVGQHDGQIEVTVGDDRLSLPAGDVVVLPIENTSAEHLARYLCGRLVDELGVRCPDAQIDEIELEVQETSGQSAIYHRTVAMPAP